MENEQPLFVNREQAYQIFCQEEFMALPFSPDPQHIGMIWGVPVVLPYKQ